MAELYIFDKDDNFLNILSKETGLIDTWFKDYQNHIPDEPFVFYIKNNSPLLHLIIEENQVAFYDRDNDLRLMRMKEVYEVSSDEGYIVTVKCEPSFLELYDHFIEDKRIFDGIAQEALNKALQGSRYIGEVTVDLGTATDNFYWTNGIEAIFKILNTWGGALKDTIKLDNDNEIIERKILILERLGKDSGIIVEPGYNAEQIQRKTLSYPVTALWAQGASLETDNGGYTRYITFADVEWKKLKGDPVDKPKGQKWVGDPQALQKYGYLHNGVRKHRFGHFSNQDYDNPKELLKAAWESLQEQTNPEITHEATIDVKDKHVSLGDTATILDRNYNKPIELQSQVTGLEYDILDMDRDVKIIVGKYVDMSENPMQQQVDDLENTISQSRPKWDQADKPINKNKYPDIKPNKPLNVTAIGAFQTIQLYWDYTDEIYVNYYEVYGSQISNFIPDEQHLLWRGKVSAFGHEVSTDEKWYYYVRAVNYHDRGSDFSDRVEASTVRVISDDILFGSILAEHLQDNLDIADKLTQNTIDRINQGPMQAIQYTQEEIEVTENRILEQLNNEIGDVNTSITDLRNKTSGIEGTVTNINQEINTIDGKLSTTITQLSNINGVVSEHTATLKTHAGLISAKAEKSEVYTRTQTDGLLGDKVDVTVYNNKVSDLTTSINGISGRVSNTETNINNLTGDLKSAKSQIASLDVKADGITQKVSDVRADLDGLEIGGTNLLLNSEDTVSIDNSFKSFDIIEDSLVNMKGKSFVLSFEARSLDGEGQVIRAYTRGGYTSDIELVDISTSWNRYEIVFNLPSENVGQIAFHTGGYGATYFHGQVRRVKLEKGNKATDYSPAIEDTDARITSAESEISTLAGEVKLRATKTSVDSLAGKMANAESTIDLLHNNIKLKVDEDGVIASINVSPEGIRIDGNRHHITGQTLIDDAVIGTAAIADMAVTRAKLGTAVVGTAQIEDAAITNAKIKSVSADKVSATSLSSISANLGTVRSGRMLSQNSNWDLNMNTGYWKIQNMNLKVGNGADIEFLDVGNRLYYQQYDSVQQRTRSAGFGVGRSINDRLPFAFLGTGTGSKPHPKDEDYFSGFIANTTKRTSLDNIGNSVVGKLFHVRDKAVGFGQGFSFDLTGSINSFYPMYSNTHLSDLGKPSNNWRRLYVRGLRTDYGYITFRNQYEDYTSQGFRMDTTYDGDDQLYFRGINSGDYHSLGKPGGWRFRHVYLKYQPNVSSDVRLKTGITDIDVASEIIDRLKPVQFRFKLSNKDLELKQAGNMKRGVNKNQYGFIAQDVQEVLDELGVTNQSLVTKGEDNYLGMQTTQIIPLLVKAFQDEKKRNDELEERLQKLEQLIS